MEEHSDAPVDRTIFSVIHRQATQAPLSEVAGLLQEVLSSRLTAYLAGASSTAAIARLVSGQNIDIDGREAELKLRTAYEITLLLLQFDAPETVRAWFIGMNPELDDRAPVEVIRSRELEDAMGAARAFIAYG